MKRKTILLCTCAVLWSILVIGLAWWYTPAAFLSDVAPEDITRIEVCNGTSGEKFTITDRDDITYIVTGIQDTKMRKQEFAKKDGFVYSMSFYTEKGKAVAQFELNGENVICDGEVTYKTMYDGEFDPLGFQYVQILDERK